MYAWANSCRHGAPTHHKSQITATKMCRRLTDVAPGLVVKEVADAAVVAREFAAARRALRAHRLAVQALHAHHLGHHVAVHAVVACLVVAQPGVEAEGAACKCVWNCGCGGGGVTL